MSGKESFYTSREFWVNLALVVFIVLTIVAAIVSLEMSGNMRNSPEGLGW